LIIGTVALNEIGLSKKLKSVQKIR
jgi:hypothetical protein